MRDTARLESDLTVREVAELRNVSHRTVRRAIARGELPAYRYGRAIRIRRADAEAFGRRIPSAASA